MPPTDETAGSSDAAHEAALSEIERRWGTACAAHARSRVTALLTLAEAADRAPDASSQRALLEDVTTQLRALGSQEQYHPLMTDDQVVSTLVDAIRLAVWLGVPETGLRLAEPVTVLSRMLGHDHPHTLTARFALASAYRAAGDVQQAVTLGEQVVEGTVALLGPDHPRTLTARSSLASAYRAAGQVEQAVRVHKELAADAARVLGAEHPDALSARNNLAQAYESCGHRHRALALYDDLVHDAERALGPQHPYLAVFVRNRERARNRGSREDGDKETSTEAGRDA
ncbi:tetratricopeptide repeat protein [Actinomyces wuliandei]|uniref:tetratricopeptide repeat protein n=1 Tax=Actinomyces wuliandei TaxID=2057743 RepID=UPI00111ADBCE|nr:tetratricopeptide repeat protein [Actinomyces wuliandei]